MIPTSLSSNRKRHLFAAPWLRAGSCMRQPPAATPPDCEAGLAAVSIPCIVSMCLVSCIELEISHLSQKWWHTIAQEVDHGTGCAKAIGAMIDSRVAACYTPARQLSCSQAVSRLDMQCSLSSPSADEGFLCAVLHGKTCQQIVIFSADSTLARSL